MADDYPSPEDQAEAQRIVEAVERLLRKHEVEDHHGGVCLAERAGFIAFLAHRTGVRSVQAVAMLVQSIQEYEEQHVEHEVDGLLGGEHEHLH